MASCSVVPVRALNTILQNFANQIWRSLLFSYVRLLSRGTYKKVIDKSLF